MDTDGFPVADFFADFPADHVGFTLIHTKLADLNLHLEYVGNLHRRIEVIGYVVGFAFFSTSNLQCARGSGYGEFFAILTVFAQ
jgi:hypothetical protein